MTVRRMTREQRSIYIDMLAIAWDSDVPGTIDLSEDSLCRELGVFKRTLRRLLRDFPATWRREGRKLVQPKLELQWAKYQEISAKRSASAMQMHMQKGGSAFASASAPAPARSNDTPPTPPLTRGDDLVFGWMGETICVEMGRRKRLPSLENLVGGRADDVIRFLARKGFNAKIVRNE